MQAILQSHTIAEASVGSWFMYQYMLFTARVLLCRAAATATPPVIVCYYPQWAHEIPGIGRFLPSDLSPGLCSHIIFAFVNFNAQYQVCSRSV